MNVSHHLSIIHGCNRLLGYTIRSLQPFQLFLPHSKLPESSCWTESTCTSLSIRLSKPRFPLAMDIRDKQTLEGCVTDITLQPWKQYVHPWVAPLGSTTSDLGLQNICWGLGNRQLQRLITPFEKKTTFMLRNAAIEVLPSFQSFHQRLNAPLFTVYLPLELGIFWTIHQFLLCSINSIRKADRWHCIL